MTVLLSRQRLKQRLGGLPRRGWSTQFGRPKGLFQRSRWSPTNAARFLGMSFSAMSRLTLARGCWSSGRSACFLSARGKGSAAIWFALADELNEPLVLVLGFPAYYRRFWFQRASAFGSLRRMEIPDDAWIAVTLSSYSPALRGKVIWPPAFSGVT